MVQEIIRKFIIDYSWVGGMGLLIAGIIKFGEEVKWNKWHYIVGGFVLITTSLLLKQ